MKDFKIPGTELPIIPRDMLYRCAHWKEKEVDVWGTPNGEVYCSFGSRVVDGEVWIEAEREYYSGDAFYLFKEEDLITLTNKENKMEVQKLTVPATDVLKIHEIACSGWKKKIATYLSRVDVKQMITFTQEEVDAMFDAATKGQELKLIEIFGRAEKIDFTKIKTGSKVMIKYAGSHCSGIEGIDINEPVDVVFYKTRFLINVHGFSKEGIGDSYVTFHQGGKFVLFASDSEIDYITKVIQY